jgi:hypothetical protein
MKIKPLSLFLFFLCTSHLPAQISTYYRAKADSCIKAGNTAKADSLYTYLIAFQPEAQDYISRAAIRKQKTPCRACGDLFSASLLGDKNAIKQFRRDCYRANITQQCTPDSFSLFCERGKVTMKQQLQANHYRVLHTDTTFRKVSTTYLSGNDTLPLFTNTCPMPDSVRFKIYKYIGEHNHYGNGTILPFVIGHYSKPEESDTSVLFTLTFSHQGVLLNAETVGRRRHNRFDDAEILRMLNTMPAVGKLNCEPGAYRYQFVIYFGHQW